MSASREKKERRAAPAAQQTAGKKSGMSKGLKTTLIVAAIAVFVALVVFFTMLSGGYFASHTTAAVVGTHKLSPAMVNYFFKGAQTSLQNQYGDLYSYIIDSNTPLSEQYYDEEQGVTWADYLTEEGLKTAVRTYSIYDAAIADGATLSEDTQAQIDSTLDNLDMYAQLGNFGSANGYLTYVYGTGCNKQNFRQYLELTELAADYATNYEDSLTYTPEQIAEEYAANPNDYDRVSYRTFFYSYSDVQGDDADITDETKAETKALAEQMAQSVTGEEQFVALCKENAPEASVSYYDDDSYTLREDYAYSACLPATQDWLFDAARVEGDCAALESEAGYYVVYYISRSTNDFPLVNVRHILISVSDTSDEAAMDDAKLKAEDLLAQYESGDQTEEAFAELARTNSADTGAGDGGLYENVYPGQMVTAFNDWCFDAARKSGDVGIVQTDYGYHVVYFVGYSDTTYQSYLVENALRENDYTAWESSLTDGVTYTLNAKAAKRGGKK